MSKIVKFDEHKPQVAWSIIIREDKETSYTLEEYDTGKYVCHVMCGSFDELGQIRKRLEAQLRSIT